MPKTPITGYTLRQLAGTWAAGFGFAAFLTWAIQGLLKQESHAPSALLLIGGTAVLALVATSLFEFNGPSSAKWWAICIGLLTAPPLFFLLGYPGLAYFVFVGNSTEVKIVQWTCIAISTTLWIYTDVTQLRKWLINDGALERALTYNNGQAFLPWDGKIDLTSPSRPLGNGSFWLRHGYKFIAVALSLSQAGYAIARLLDASVGIKGILLAMTSLGLPLLLFMASKLARSAYFYVFVLSQIEKRTGHPVEFSGMPTT